MGVEACDSDKFIAPKRGMERLYVSRDRPEDRGDAIMRSLDEMRFIWVPCMHMSHDLGMDGR